MLFVGLKVIGCVSEHALFHDSVITTFFFYLPRLPLMLFSLNKPAILAEMSIDFDFIHKEG